MASTQTAGNDDDKQAMNKDIKVISKVKKGEELAKTKAAEEAQTPPICSLEKLEKEEEVKR